MCLNCEISDKGLRKLLNHYVYLYPEINNKYRPEFYKKYRALGYSQSKSIQCCNNELLELYIEKDEPLQIIDGTWACPICGLHIKDMSSHVKNVHELTWDTFVKTFNWKGSKIYFSETYRQNLRDNKLNFYYNTSEGELWRNDLGRRVSGNSNPTCRDDVKLKISKARKGKHLQIKDRARVSASTNTGIYSPKAKSYGYIFWAVVNGRERRFRSRLEYLVFLMLSYYGVKFEYEPFKLEYYDPDCEYLRHYIVDFTVGNRLFEVKPKVSDFSKDSKYDLIQAQLSKSGKQLEVLTASTLYSMFDIDKQEKPLSFFEELVLENIRCGNCKLQIPQIHEPEFYYNSNYMKKLGANPKEIIENGRIIYENKISTGIM